MSITSPVEPGGQDALGGERHAGFAETWWALDLKKSSFEDDLSDVLGGDFDRIGGDSYDNSLEIREVENHVRLSAAAQRLIWGAGFRKAYVNHKDGWETHYTWDWRKPKFKAVRGWRRKAKPGGSGFWISFWPASWTRREWLESGYMTVEPDPLEVQPRDQQVSHPIREDDNG